MGWEVSNYRYLKLTAEVKQKEYLPVRQYIPSTSGCLLRNGLFHSLVVGLAKSSP